MRYARQGAEAHWVRSFLLKEPAMIKTELYNHGADADPPISFATDDEIEFADQLRHRLEERYLARPAPSSECGEEIRTSLRHVDDAGGAL
jgi:hypothetical protein